jgi:5'-3' exonuclease
MQAFNENLKRMQKAIFKPKEKVSPQEAFIDENFDRERDVLCEMFNEVCIRWHMDEIVEGDDLIAYYCLHKRENERILIISADMDLTQLLSDEVMIYNQKLKKYISNKNFKQYFGYDYRNTLVKKIFCGDTSDNIGNIKGLSEAKLFEIMPEIKDRGVTVEEVKQRAQMLNEERVKEKKKPFKVYENIIEGVATKDYDGDFYEINEKLVNLHKPILTDEAKEEADGLIEAPLDMEDRNIANLVGIIEREKVEELMGDTRFASFFAPFKRIIGIEDDFYRKSLSE